MSAHGRGQRHSPSNRAGRILYSPCGRSRRSLRTDVSELLPEDNLFVFLKRKKKKKWRRDLPAQCSTSFPEAGLSHTTHALGPKQEPALNRCPSGGRSLASLSLAFPFGKPRRRHERQQRGHAGGVRARRGAALHVSINRGGCLCAE